MNHLSTIATTIHHNQSRTKPCPTNPTAPRTRRSDRHRSWASAGTASGCVASTGGPAGYTKVGTKHPMVNGSRLTTKVNGDYKPANG